MNVRKPTFLLLVFLIFCSGLHLAGQDRKKQSTPLFKVDVETVFVKVAVSDPLNRYVTGLEKEHLNLTARHIL